MTISALQPHKPDNPGQQEIACGEQEITCGEQEIACDFQINWVNISTVLMLIWGTFHEWFFLCNQNLKGICFQCNSIEGNPIATKFCTCHDSTAVLSCPKFHSALDHNLDESRMKLPLDLNYDGKIVDEMGSSTEPSAFISVSKREGSQFCKPWKMVCI